MQDDRAVLEEDAAVHDGLAVDDDPHVFVGYSEEVVHLYDLEALVHHRGGVYCDLGSHLPRRVLECILGTGVPQARLVEEEERPARGG